MELLVNICIATYNRPDLLSILIHSIEQQILSQTLKINLTVVDNDINRTAEYTVLSVKKNFFQTVNYCVEPIQNISLARNRALAAATADYIVFVDDDEYVAEDWLENLIQTAESENADVVFGPVIAVYPPNTPDWIVSGGFFERLRHPTGTPMSIGASGNTLIKSSSLSLLDSHFDADYGLTGGEDGEFFSRLNKKGALMVWCDTALAYEEVPYQRMRIRWLMSRNFRGGQNYWRISVSKQPIMQKIIWFCSRLAALFMSLLLTPFCFLAGKSNGLKMLRHSANYAGQLSGLLGIYQKGY